MNPKISDFGLARLFGGDQTQGITSRVVGTYGYMAREYVLRGNYSVKSDVFSFSVMVVEIVTGKKKNDCYTSRLSEDLLTLVSDVREHILDSCLKIVAAQLLTDRHELNDSGVGAVDGRVSPWMTWKNKILESCQVRIK
ncbi:Cysteine-rich receptor-like protein kinase 15 [Triticum urartu]|uniref:Cysteine-rich receptor-like protein kinase 15 n=1 Tax=Triticum urartu TaxID=4572 RepID=M8A8Q9_TRIUA|nr:Cysteine-rich receptor-like protein kinase 15 [Triticum urartu]